MFSFTNIHDLQDSREKVKAISPLYHFYSLHRHSDISRAITAKISIQLAAGLELGTFNFQAQVTNH